MANDQIKAHFHTSLFLLSSSTNLLQTALSSNSITDRNALESISSIIDSFAAIQKAFAALEQPPGTLIDTITAESLTKIYNQLIVSFDSLSQSMDHSISSTAKQIQVKLQAIKEEHSTHRHRKPFTSAFPGGEMIGVDGPIGDGGGLEEVVEQVCLVAPNCF